VCFNCIGIGIGIGSNQYFSIGKYKEALYWKKGTRGSEEEEGQTVLSLFFEKNNNTTT
jgi:hypothetical protein